MKSLRDTEGYFMQDNRDSSGVPDELVVAYGLPPGAGRGLFESATYTCRHCNYIIVMNPDRSRERIYCKGCQHIICDRCAAEKALTGICKTMDQVIEEALFKSTQPFKEI